jgi:hypothetical protein
MGVAQLAESGRPSIWNRLFDQGYQVAVFDLPKCGRPQPTNGVHLWTGWCMATTSLSHCVIRMGLPWACAPALACSHRAPAATSPAPCRMAAAAWHYLAGRSMGSDRGGVQERPQRRPPAVVSGASPPSRPPSQMVGTAGPPPACAAAGSGRRHWLAGNSRRATACQPSRQRICRRSYWNGPITC